ncbi:MAG TPA: hypothetical protein VMU01_03090 [Rhizomicrobium sp.]|nr:hypothetical protein [Rhizomicrobium sp.]
MLNKIACATMAAMLAGCASAVLPHESSNDTAKFATYEQVMASYNGIALGKTGLNDLPALGFDTRTTPNVEVLSYTEIVDHFLPSETMRLEQAPVAARRCLETQDRCSAYIIHLQHSQKQRNGGVVPDLLGVERDTVTNGWSAKIVLVLQDNVVVYKEMSGIPNSEEHHDTTQPLGPLQDLSKSIPGATQTQQGTGSGTQPQDTGSGTQPQQ